MPIQLLETYIRKVTTFAKLIKIILSNTPKSSFFQIKREPSIRSELLLILGSLYANLNTYFVLASIKVAVSSPSS